MCVTTHVPAAIVTASLIGVLATSSLAEQQPAVTSPKTLVIVQAEYGAEDKWIDVTDQVAAAVRGNVLMVQAGNDLAGDPIAGVVKQLKVAYTLDGEPHTALVPEFGLLVIQSDHALEDLAELSRRRGIYLPYRHVNPITPAPRTLEPHEAEAILQRDWLFQAEGKPLAERAAAEIGWTRQLAARLAMNPKTPDLNEDLAELDDWEAQLGRNRSSPLPLVIVKAEYGAEDKWFDVTDHVAAAVRGNVLRVQAGNDLAGDPIPHVVKQLRVVYKLGGQQQTAVIREHQWCAIPSDAASISAEDPARHREIYLGVRAVKRRILFKNPLVDFTQVLFIDQPYPEGPETIHEAIHRLGIWAVPGGRLLVLDGLAPGGKVRLLAPHEKPGSFWRPDLSFDAARVLFCCKPHDEKSFHLYEMNLDGTDLRQLTDSDYDDIDPIYLPDGRILFTTLRGNSYVRCGPFVPSYILARCDADGGNVYLISYNGEPDFVPALLNDGRVIYSRWEYTDKPLWRLQKLWTTNPDGTGTAHFWGNQSVWPDHTSEPRPIPNSNRVMFSGVGHHDWWSGSIGIIDPDQGRDFPHGLTKVTADLPWPEVTAPPVDPIESADYHSAGQFTGYKSPWPLSEEDFLVSARGEGEKFRLYLMDVHGNRELIYEGAHNILHAIPVKPRAAPPRQPDRVVWPGTGEDRQPVQPGVFYSADILRGVRDLPREMVYYVRVFQLDYKTYSTWHKTYRNSGPAVSIVQEEGVKRILSEVPVESDGSAHFEAPAGVSLFFQLLDKDRRALQTMRSFTGLMPGESRGCLGCHERHSTAPPSSDGLAVALLRPPTPLSPPPWGTESISYERFAQPVLDRYCVQCHQGDTEGSYAPDLRLRPGHGPFKEPYLTLVGPAAWEYAAPADRPGYGIANVIPVESAYGQNDPAGLVTLPPLRYLSYGSRLIELASSGGHYDVKVDPVSLHRLIAWVDSCGVYQGEPEIRALGDPDFPAIELLPIRPRAASAPVIERP